MKKVININFHSRVIPIEESAYDILKQYSESLRKYFANEEGRDEIINDIENRIAELFSELLKKGANCITDADVTNIIDSMGRPEDFEAADADSGIGNTSSVKQDSSSNQQSQQQRAYNYTPPPGRGRFYRNADDKLIGGVCSGLANYLGIDPVILRIIFVVLFGALLWVYILLWIIVPSQSLHSNITKRLYRSSDDRVIGGVAGGLAAYFNMQAWIPRLIFALPFVLGITSGIFHAAFWNWDYGFGPRFISGGLGSTLILTYIILWIAVPIATTASEKLEMRGEKVDLNSIANTIKEDLEGFKGRAEKVGASVKEGAERFAGEFKATAQEKSKAFASEIHERRKYNEGGSGVGHVIGVLFKAFFLFIAGVIALALFGVLIGLLFGGVAVLPLKGFLLSGFTENFLAWASLILFLGIPLLALLTWLIRRIMGARSRNHYLGYVFGSLWIIGLVCIIVLFSMFVRSFRVKDFVEDEIKIAQPAKGKMYIDLANGITEHHYHMRNWGMNWDTDWPLYGENYDSLILNTVRINIVKSKDSSFHVHRLRFSRGESTSQAQELAKKINFDITQQDSTILLAHGFGISKHEKFRNQQLLVVLEVPVGKKIEINKDVDDYHWFNININRRHGWNISDDEDWDDNWGDNYGWRSEVEYIMTKDGLERTDKKYQDDDGDNTERKKEEPKVPATGTYRYKNNIDSVKENHQKPAVPKKEPVKKDSAAAEKRLAKIATADQASSPLYLLTKVF
jgi:phage shock protein PspC (stress-responsive transcriptional regulator)